MILGLEIGLLIAGIVALATGKMKLSKTKAAVGTPARIAGVIAMLPLPAAFMVGAAVGATSFAAPSRHGGDKRKKTCGPDGPHEPRVKEPKGKGLPASSPTPG